MISEIKIKSDDRRQPCFYRCFYDLCLTPVRLSSAADVHRPGPAGPKLWRDRSRQRRVLAGRGDDQRREQPKRGRLPVRRGQSHRQRGPPVTTAERTTKTRSQGLHPHMSVCLRRTLWHQHLRNPRLPKHSDCTYAYKPFRTCAWTHSFGSSKTSRIALFEKIPSLD